jgi:ribosomal protein L11 methyltransferase
MPWLILHIESDEQHCTAIEDALLECSAAAVTLQDSADQPLFDEPDTESAKLWQRVQISGMFDAAVDIDAIMRQLQSQPGLDIGRHRVEILEDKDWVRSWMDSYQAMPMGGRLWICPSWLQPPDQAAVNLVLDPGMAFGTGTHPTTAMCLRWLDAQSLAGKTIIDFGCGSGILAIAALLLGAESACGTDIDPQAIAASQSNAQRNQVDENRLHLCFPEDMTDVEPADIVLANVLAGPLIKLATTIGALVKPGGHLVLSGILQQQAGQVSAAYPDFDFAAPREEDGWVLLTATRRVA